MTRYAHASNKLLGIQIDAAINPGELLSMDLAHASTQMCLQTCNVKASCTTRLAVSVLHFMAAAWHALT